MRLFYDESSLQSLNSSFEEELHVHLFCEHDWKIGDVELNSNTFFRAYYTR